MTGKVLTFNLCGSLCGIDIAFAKEISRDVTFTQIPGEQTNILGLLSLRGQIVTLFDLGKTLTFNNKQQKQGQHCIILKSMPTNPDPIGFFVDALGDVITVTDDMCEPAPANIYNKEGRFITEVVKLENDIVLVLDLEKIVSSF